MKVHDADSKLVTVQRTRTLVVENIPSIIIDSLNGRVHIVTVCKVFLSFGWVLNRGSSIDLGGSHLIGYV